MSRGMRFIASSVMVAAVVAMGTTPWRSAPSVASAQDDGSGNSKQLYDQIKAFKLTGGSADVSNLTLKRDRVEMTFTGTFYFAGAIDGVVTGAVFNGQGTVRAAAPPSDFEKDNVKRLLGADAVESDFKTAVLRFSDDTFGLISANRKDGVAPANIQKLANDTDARILQEQGVNLPVRLATGILNGDRPGVFFAQFDGGRRARFNYLFDPQGRIPVAAFNLSGGEKGLIYQYQNAVYFNEIWMAFLGLDDYAKGNVTYSDADDVIDVQGYQLNIDVRRVPMLALSTRIDFTARKANARAIFFRVGESLSMSQQESRLTNQLRVKRVRFGDRELSTVQEDWEGGFTVFLPKPLQANEPVTLTVDLEGQFFQSLPGGFSECFYLFNNVTWLPRHGYLDRATFDFTLRYRKRDKVVAAGTRVSDDPDPEDPQAMMAKYKLTSPVAFTTFAVGPFERKVKQVTLEGRATPLPVEFNSVPARVLQNTNMVAVNSDLILDELGNDVGYFSAMFGQYPYETFGAAFHPFGFGQSPATMMMLPPATRGRESNVYSFFAHETAHQWWGHAVLWRSYRDQWLSEGFAEYSGLLYSAKRTGDPLKTTMELVRDMRDELLQMPGTASGGAGKGRLNDIGPIVLGFRLTTTKTLGAYQALIYSKGALVLRMLHFLLSNPTNGNDAEFRATMKDFVDQHRNGSAGTEDFWRVASTHFARTPIAGKYGLSNLDWFFKQWVYGTGLPSYSLDYETKTQPDGSLMLTGTIKQDNVPADWQMVLPLVMSFDNNQEARTSVRANGPSTPFEIKVPIKPKKVDLDPFMWVLSEKTVSRGK